MFGKNSSEYNLRAVHPACASFCLVRIALSVLAGAMLALMVMQAAAPAPAWALPTPLDTVNQVINTSLPVLRDKKTPLPQRRRQLRDLLEQHFDFADMARIALGYHWRELSPGQRIEFVAVFTRFIEDAYLSKLQDYSVKKVADELPSVNIQFTREAFDGPDYAQVYSTVMLKEQKDPIELNYLMHLTDGKWKVYDVTVDAISVIGNYRNQINRTINEGSYDQLITNLRTKTAALQQELDNPNPTRE